MLWIIHCQDAANTSELRASKVKEHVAYLKAQTLKILLAGPLLQNDNNTSYGSLFLVEHDNFEEVKAFAHQDPFALSGIWQHIQINTFKRSDVSELQF